MCPHPGVLHVLTLSRDGDVRLTLLPLAPEEDLPAMLRLPASRRPPDANPTWAEKAQSYYDVR